MIKSVDREIIPDVIIDVTAKDCVSNQEDIQWSTLNVIIYIDDINDNPPIFNNPKSFDIGITKDTQFNTNIYDLKVSKLICL